MEGSELDGGRGEKDKEHLSNCGVGSVMAEYTWEFLHSRHVWMRTMWHRNARWGLQVSRSQLEEEMANCVVCQRNRWVVRYSWLGKLDDTTKPCEKVAADFVGPIDVRYLLI